MTYQGRGSCCRSCRPVSGTPWGARSSPGRVARPLLGPRGPTRGRETPFPGPSSSSSSLSHSHLQLSCAVMSPSVTGGSRGDAMLVLVFQWYGATVGGKGEMSCKLTGWDPRGGTVSSDGRFASEDSLWWVGGGGWGERARFGGLPEVKKDRVSSWRG